VSDTDTHTAEWIDAQAERTYQESRRLALDASGHNEGGPECWEYDGSADEWGVGLMRYLGTERSTGSEMWLTVDFEHCPSRDDARSLATQRNTPPRLQSASPDAAPAREVGL